MKKFEAPELQVAVFSVEDVITRSGLGDTTGEPAAPTKGDVGTDIL